jgi:hypothetical protein
MNIVDGIASLPTQDLSPYFNSVPWGGAFTHTPLYEYESDYYYVSSTVEVVPTPEPATLGLLAAGGLALLRRRRRK